MTDQDASNVLLVQTAFRLAGEEAWEAFFELFSANCVIHHPDSLPFGGVYRGEQAIRFAFRRVLAAWEEVVMEKLAYFAQGDQVVVHMRAGGVGRTRRNSFWQDLMELWRIENGKIVEMRPFFFDTARLKEVF